MKRTSLCVLLFIIIGLLSCTGAGTSSGCSSLGSHNICFNDSLYPISTGGFHNFGNGIYGVSVENAGFSAIPYYEYIIASFSLYCNSSTNFPAVGSYQCVTSIDTNNTALQFTFLMDYYYCPSGNWNNPSTHTTFIIPTSLATFEITSADSMNVSGNFDAILIDSSNPSDVRHFATNFTNLQ